MTDATFPGNGNYLARLEAWRSGFTIYGRLTVIKTGGYGYWTNNPQPYATHVAGLGGDGTWTYDFRNYNSKVVAEWSRTVGGPGDYQVGAWVEMDGFGRAQPANMVVNVPPGAPAPPTMLRPVRNSDTSHGVFWKDNATPAAPYTYLQVQRRMFDGSWQNFVGIAADTAYNTSGNNRSYGDNGTVANRIYVYRIYVNNGAGEAYSSESPWVFTTPAAPKNVQAVKQASGSIVLTWTNGPPHTEINTNIDYSIDGGTTWTALVSGLAGKVSTYTHATPPAAANIVYRVRHTIAQPNPVNNVGIGLTSAYGQSNLVGLTAPPNAPSALSPNGTVFDATTAQTFTWRHNNVDSSTQTAYEIQYRIGTAAWTSTGKITSGDSLRTFAPNTFTNGKTYEWQVRTWGAHADPSPWSASATFTTSAAPLVAIGDPPNPLEAALVTTTWTYSDAEGTAQSAWEAQLLQSSSTLEQLAGSGDVTSASFTTRLVDATTYQVRVRARDGSGLWSQWAQKTFTSSFPSPAIPLISVVWDINTGIAGITVNNPDVGTAVINNKVMRSTDEGSTWVEVASTPPDGTGFDKTVPLNASVMYQVIAWTDLPSSASSMSTLITTTASYGYWSAGSDLEYNFGMRANYQKPPQYGVEKSLAQKTLHYFAGRTKPVEYSGTATTVTGSVEFATRDLNEWAQVDRMSTVSGPHLLRFTNGMVVKCSIEPVSITKINKLWHQISFSFQEVD